MTKYFLSGALLAIMLMAGPVFAQVDSMEADFEDEFAGSTADSMEADFEDELVGNSDAGLTPSSPFYFLDSWGESLSLFFTFNNEKKAEKRLIFAEEKLAELELLAADEDADSEKLQKRIDKSLSKYERHMDRLVDRLNETTPLQVGDLAKRVAERTDFHQDVLDGVMDRVPEQAKQRIHNAAIKSQQGHTKALRALANVDPVASAELVMDQAERRLRNAEKKAKDDPDAANRELDHYKNRIEMADELTGRVAQAGGQDWDVFEQKMQDRQQRHMINLERVRDQVPEQARGVIDTNIQRAQDRNSQFMNRMREHRGGEFGSMENLRGTDDGIVFDGPQTLRDGILVDGPQTLRDGILVDGPETLRDGILVDGPQTLRDGIVFDGPEILRDGVVVDGPATVRDGFVGD